MSRYLTAVLTILVVLTVWRPALRAAAILVPNASFELPEVVFVEPVVDSWQNRPQPQWYDESREGPWSQQTGVFKNTPPTSANHIDNCDGNQAIWLFANPDAGLFQDYDSTGGTNTTPTHSFDAKFDVGKSYQLTAGVIGGGGGMLEGASLEISLYYRDAASNMVTVAATSITNTQTIFPTNTHLIDFQVRMPSVKPSEPWSGQHIGVQFLSTVSLEMRRGYWDLDNVRLEAFLDPLALSFMMAGPDLRISWLSATGYHYQMKISDDLDFWSDYDSPLPGTGGELSKLVSKSGQANAFFKVLAMPAR
jgi:hypothetical protein